ncbi:MAG: FliM/FliN family flagellar motor switch protein [Acidobacteriota bacterium]
MTDSMKDSKISIETVTHFIRETLKSCFAAAPDGTAIIEEISTPEVHAEWLWLEQSFQVPQEIVFYAGVPKLSSAELKSGAGSTVPDQIPGFVAALTRNLSETLQSVVMPSRQAEAEPPADAMRLDFQVRIQQKCIDIAIALPDVTALRIAEGRGKVSSKRGRSSVLDGLMDVQLPVTVSLGSKEVPLFDVLKFGNGSVIEFDHGLDEPVQIIVDRRVVALGDIVLIDGNYGVRISEICQPQIQL